MAKPDVKDVAIEVLKTGAGVIAGRAICNIVNDKVLKTNQETDPKKKKMKEALCGAGVMGLGIFGATKLDSEYASVAAGVAGGGLLKAISPFGKEDKGIIPVLNGMGSAHEEEQEYDDFPEDDEYTEDADYEDVTEEDSISRLGEMHEINETDEDLLNSEDEEEDDYPNLAVNEVRGLETAMKEVR